MVEPVSLKWDVPGCKQLWLGTQASDNTNRLKAFLSCMLSDSPSMTKTTMVPQRCIILCCVLRYVAVLLIFLGQFCQTFLLNPCHDQKYSLFRFYPLFRILSPFPRFIAFFSSVIPDFLFRVLSLFPHFIPLFRVLSTFPRSVRFSAFYFLVPRLSFLPLP